MSFSKNILIKIPEYESTTHTSKYLGTLDSLIQVSYSLRQINHIEEVFLSSELDDINKIISLAKNRKRRDIIGESNILKDERQKTINNILNDSE